MCGQIGVALDAWGTGELDTYLYPMTQLEDDWHAETLTRLERSKFYQILKARVESEPAAGPTVQLVNDATHYAFHRTKTILRHMGEFTLHDGDHLFRVLLLMELLVADQADGLSTPELLLLILSAFFHDIGMAADERDVLSWKKVWDAKPSLDSDHEREECERFRRYCSGRPEQMDRIKQLISESNHSAAEVARNYLITEFIRLTHADRAREIVKTDWGGRIRYRDTDLTVEFATICFSHNEDAAAILDLDKRMVCGPNVHACLPLVAVVLRLADILDFDGKRTPDILFSHLFVRHPISLQEWTKHRSVEAWTVSPSMIQFHAKCSHPAVEASIHAFCDLIDRELGTGGHVLTLLNEFHRQNERRLRLSVPLRVDRSKIETRKTIEGTPEYLYRQTQFTLSKTQVIDLLMGTRLYGNPEVALRELLQNSIDACLLRQALENRWNNVYTPQIRVRYTTSSEEDLLEVSDNGVGMDQHIVDTYYTKVGSSFYKSAEFNELKSQTNAKFAPMSRFGIGILACFMVADTVVVDTRRVLGAHQSSQPLSLTIEGQDSIFWIKVGTLTTPGTTTKLHLRKTGNPWQRMSDEQFHNSVESVLPNPPFDILVESNKEKRTRTATSFKEVSPAELRDFSWSPHENIREFEVDLDCAEEGFVGKATIGVLESHGRPTKAVEMVTKSVTVDENEYELRRALTLSNRHISSSTTSLTVDENGNVEASESYSQLARSKSKISLHGIDIPTTLFRDYWSTSRKSVELSWPLPILLVIDICGERDLDLNSARTEIVMSSKWIDFEDSLLKKLAQGVAQQVNVSYWRELRPILGELLDSRAFGESLDAIQPGKARKKARKTS
jgi:molecular chaperone HtpG